MDERVLAESKEFKVEKEKAAAHSMAGRPPEMEGGKRVNVYIDSESLAIAAKLGNGNVSDGIRKSLKQAE